MFLSVVGDCALAIRLVPWHAALRGATVERGVGVDTVIGDWLRERVDDSAF
jgi:hypothetical protein